MKRELQWWVDNLPTQSRQIVLGNPELTMTTDASNEGWGATLGVERIGGRWDSIEKQHHINILELLAVDLALKSFEDQIQRKHVQLLIDNTTAVAYVNNMGGKHDDLNQLANSMWIWAIERHVWLSASYIPGVDNVQADFASRNFNDRTEWSLNPQIFTELENMTVLRKQSISKQAVNIMLSSWKYGTHKQYSTYYARWYKFCVQREVDHVQPNVSEVLDFLTELYEAGLGYSAINTARCALSQITVYKKGFTTIGAHPWVIRFLKGVYNLRPPMPRYVDTWDVGKLLCTLRKLSPVSTLSLKHLTLTTVTLVAILLAARTQTLVALDLENMTVKTSKYCFTVGKATLKQSRPSYTPPVLELGAYPVDRRLCVYTVLREYIKSTQALRGEQSQLFISYTKPHAKVTAATISRWIKLTMRMAGIDVSIYKSHSVRAASTSKACDQGVPIEEILLYSWLVISGNFCHLLQEESTKGQNLCKEGSCYKVKICSCFIYVQCTCWLSGVTN
ncbi:uncharacterized protein [Amphiura filiformis]|uniref:uncharacterized protein n=1 Tax=Amphiura filiformis TaxID=82378 RepID=UPI003B22549F